MKRLWSTRPTQPLQGPSKWVPVLGELQKTLQRGEYLPLCPLPMFESNFVQVTDGGSPVLLHHRTNRVTMGVAASLPGLVLPDILLIARPQTRKGSCLELTRMIPLDLTRLYVHDTSARRLKLRLVTGRCYYLDLEAPDHEVGFLFDCWMRLAHLLQESAGAWGPRPLRPSGLDVPVAKVPASTWHLQDLAHSCTATVAEPAFPSKTLTVPKSRKAKGRFKSRAVGNSVPLIWSQQEHADVRMRATEQRSAPSANPDRCDTQIHDSGKANVTIRTIFSIISSTILQACTPDSEAIPGREGLIETPSRCVSHDSCDFSRLGFYDPFEVLLWQRDIEAFLDPESSTLSSSLDTAPHSPTMYLFPPCPSFPRPQDKARHTDSQPGQEPPPSQNASSCAGPWWGAPVIMDQLQRVPAVLAPSQKTPAVSAGPQKSPAVPAGPQKSPVTPCPSQKAPVVLSSPHKLPPRSQMVPPVRVHFQKATCPPAPEKEPPLPPTLSQQTSTPPPRPQEAPRPPALWEQPPAQLDAALAGPLGVDVTKRSKSGRIPVTGVMVGAQETNMIETRTQKVSLDLPFTTATKESEEMLVSQAQEVTLGALQGQAKLEDRAHSWRREVSLDLPRVRSKEVRQQKRRVMTQQAAVKGPGPERSRAFSVEGLTMAKLMVMTNSAERCPRPPVASLPSQLLVTSRAAATSVDGQVSLPWGPSHPALLEATRAGVREQPESHTWVKEKMGRQTEQEPPWGPRGLSKGPLGSVPDSDSPVMAADPLVPIPLPASLWEDLPQPPLPSSSSLRAEAPAKAAQQLTRAPQEPPRMPSQQPPAMTGSSSESVLPVLLEIQSVRDAAAKVQMTKGNLGFFHPLASLLRSRRFQ